MIIPIFNMNIMITATMMIALCVCFAIASKQIKLKLEKWAKRNVRNGRGVYVRLM